MRILEALGRMVGGMLAPVVALGSSARNARVFHPNGVVYWARVQPIAKDGELGELAKRLQGPALVRLSNGIWRHDKEWPDILGIAIRFVDSKTNPQNPAARDQDLLFATIRRGVTLPLAPFFTNTHDFLGNDYQAVLPFFVNGFGKVKFRLVPLRLPGQSGTRRAKLAARAAAGTAVFRIEMKTMKFGARWKEIASLDIREKAFVDQQALAFNPFRDGRGIQPVGFFQMVRAATYKASFIGRNVTRSK